MPDDNASSTPLPPPATGPEWGKGTRSDTERKFLQGPRPRGAELGEALNIFWQCMRGFRKLHFVGPCVTVFGSARFREGHPYYELTREVGRRLAEAGFTVMTGGGPGLSTETLSFLNWQTFLVNTDFGYGGAISVMLVVLCLVMAGVVMRVMRTREAT